MARYKDTRFWNNINKIKFEQIGEYDIPKVKPMPVEEFKNVPWLSFNYAMTCRNRAGNGVHFYLDDYQFERVWTDLDRYTSVLKNYDYVMSPDYSMYTDWPKAMNIWNHYRKNYVAAHWQYLGMKVIPTICWSDKESFNWCFDGDPIDSVVTISSVGTQMNTEDKRAFMLGYDAMLERLNPRLILFYGGIPNECRGNILPISSFQSKYEKMHAKNVDEHVCNETACGQEGVIIWVEEAAAQG